MKLFKNPLTLLFSFLLMCLFSAAVTALVILNYWDTESVTTVQVQYDETSYTEVWNEAAPAVLSVVAMKDLSAYYQQFTFAPSDTLQEVSSGTAFMITPDGLAVTNRHVVSDDEAEYVAVMQDGTEWEVEVLDRDTHNDIALIRVLSENGEADFPHLDFADSDSILVGQPVAAIGNALGEYSHTMTSGIISGLGRNIVAASGRSTESLVGLLQTDAAINPGNSGGPLLNLDGEVVGMNTAVDTTAEGIGFAIPSNDIATVVTSYQENGRIVRPYVGVRYVMLTPGIRERFQLSVEEGAFVVGDENFGAVVEGSPADEAGLQAGDVITSVGGQALSTEFTLSNAVASYAVGDELAIEVWREGESFTTTLVLEELPE